MTKVFLFPLSEGAHPNNYFSGVSLTSKMTAGDKKWTSSKNFENGGVVLVPKIARCFIFTRDSLKFINRPVCNKGEG